VLRNLAGEAFMGRYHRQADLAPRDTVARAIDAEMKRSGSPHVWLDITGRPEAYLRERFPAIWAACERHGLRIDRDLIPVVPAAHYTCGGVKTDLRAATNLPGLYACGEVASTGLHGANRLASNSLLEAVVMARQGADAVIEYLNASRPAELPIPDWVDGSLSNSDEQVVITHNWDELRRCMWDYVGIVRSAKRLERARARIRNLSREIQEYYWNWPIEPRLLELRNLIQVAELVVESALLRRESRGLHYTLDYPEKDPEPRNTALSRPV
jgi:L-aspartate oxidase